MKIITKTITREEEFYIARDGKEFDDEYDCLNYENELNIKSIEAYDNDFERVDFENANYVVVHSDEELNFIREVCNYNSLVYRGLSKSGLYHYNNEVDKWEKIKIPYFLKNFVEFI